MHKTLRSLLCYIGPIGYTVSILLIVICFVSWYLTTYQPAKVDKVESESPDTIVNPLGIIVGNYSDISEIQAISQVSPQVSQSPQIWPIIITEPTYQPIDNPPVNPIPKDIFKEVPQIELEKTENIWNWLSNHPYFCLVPEKLLKQNVGTLNTNVAKISNNTDQLKELLVQRQWRNSTGHFDLEGTLEEILSDEVYLRKTDGKISHVKILNLSVKDRIYIEQVQKAAVQFFNQLLNLANKQNNL